MNAVVSVTAAATVVLVAAVPVPVPAHATAIAGADILTLFVLLLLTTITSPPQLQATEKVKVTLNMTPTWRKSVTLSLISSLLFSKIGKFFGTPPETRFIKVIIMYSAVRGLFSKSWGEPGDTVSYLEPITACHIQFQFRCPA